MASIELNWSPQRGEEMAQSGNYNSINEEQANHVLGNGDAAHPSTYSSTPSKFGSKGYESLSPEELPSSEIGKEQVYTAANSKGSLTQQHNGYTSMEPEVKYSNGTMHLEENGGKGKDGPDSQPPKDRWMLAFMIFALHGVGTLLPWNCFITAEAYFTEHKFGNLSDDVEYKDKFVSYLGLCGFLPNVAFLAIALFFPPKSNFVMTFIGLFIMMLLFVMTTILAVIDTSDWPGAFFGLTMATIVIFNGAGAIYQSGMFALAAKLPGTYTQSYIAGQGLGGTFVAVISILSLAAAGDLQKAAVGYFLCAVFILVLSVITYVFLFKLPMIKYYIRVDAKSAARSTTKKSTGYTIPPLWTIFKEIKLQILNIWLTFTISLTIFPAMMVDVEPTHDSTNWFWGTYFTPVTCFLLFNLFDFLGSIIPAWIRWPSRHRTWILVVARIVLIPLVVFCNYRPLKRTLPVLITNDYVYILIITVMSITNGYLKTIIMMDAPKCLSTPEYASKAAAMMVFFLVLGIFCGIQFSVIVAFLI